MNKQAILDLADTVERSDHFRMDSPFDCIAGHIPREFPESSPDKVVRVLGVTPHQALKIVFPGRGAFTNSHGELTSAYDATGPEAARMLRNLAETGEVDWKRAGQ